MSQGTLIDMSQGTLIAMSQGTIIDMSQGTLIAMSQGTIIANETPNPSRTTRLLFCKCQLCLLGYFTFPFINLLPSLLHHCSYSSPQRTSYSVLPLISSVPLYPTCLTSPKPRPLPHARALLLPSQSLQPAPSPVRPSYLQSWSFRSLVVVLMT